ncbi:hydantoinase B/oxoprolinase family protein [bacterium]|nr:hydantoinase B/oxoprolinase family protein [bacterium]MBP9808208.1 hydantoinase B/oxoprolinase family protein [bacterium]
MTFEFYIDRGGTFTDIVAKGPDGKVYVYKILSELPGQSQDSAILGIAAILKQANTNQQANPNKTKEQNKSENQNQQPSQKSKVNMNDTNIGQVRIGTTVATNALLERKGEPLLLVTNQGMKDAFKIGYQNRADIFALEIIKTAPIFAQVIEVPGRFGADGEEIQRFDFEQTKALLQRARDSGIRSIAIVFMHSYKYPQHEEKCASIAKEVGFENISRSSEITPLIKFISRGDTTLVDGYLTPPLKAYTDKLHKDLKSCHANLQIKFMKSDGGLTTKDYFRGRDALISGPAGGVVGAKKAAEVHGISNIIGFDMGGTSTDVCYFQGEYERLFETIIDGIRVRAPMLAVHTVAAGGGSILSFDGARFLVGPQSAGAQPGPACYGHSGPATVTDANLLLGRISLAHFPDSFGVDHDQPLDLLAASNRFNELSTLINRSRDDVSGASCNASKSIEDIAWGFLTVAIEKMAQAISKVSTQKGHDVSEATLVAFGGAGGQHACLIAERLGVKQVLISPLAGVLSAYGIGATTTSATVEQSVRKELSEVLLAELRISFEKLGQVATQKLQAQAEAANVILYQQLFLRYQDSDTTIPVELDYNLKEARAKFHDRHKKLFGFALETSCPILEEIRVTAQSQADNLVIESIQNVTTANLSCENTSTAQPHQTSSTLVNKPTDHLLFSQGQWHTTKVHVRELLSTGATIEGPALIAEYTATTIIEPGWCAEVLHDSTLLLRQKGREQNPQEACCETLPAVTEMADPVKLELFSNMFMSIAEEMGITLQQASHSVNIKERLDFSCALFDSKGRLIANAPHIPVHLGSMGDSVVSLINSRDCDSSKQPIAVNDVYVLNNPFNGGTHLPDITVISPVFDDRQERLFFVASRGHHADVGGITPGSMPPMSTNIGEEGVLLDNFLIAKDGDFNETPFVDLLESALYPPRNIRQNINDIKAQIAANNKGIAALKGLVHKYGSQTVAAYMEHVRANAALAIRNLLLDLEDGQATGTMDDGSKINVSVRINKQNRTAVIDFTGTSAQTQNNLNTPLAVSRAAVLYVFRTLTRANIPLNDGCMEPLKLIIPPGSMLNPHEPAAVVAGNVETSQVIVDTIYRALNIMAASQGTMNNFTFGDHEKQYYETICGGSGAGRSFAGTDAIQTHMTNSRLTDPEILESRFPVLLEEFSIRINSGGTGKFKGGDGTVRRIRFLKPMSASILSNRRRIKPPGLNGGNDGECGANQIVRASGKIEELGSTATFQVEPGDAIEIKTPGGGGYGNVDR